MPYILEFYSLDWRTLGKVFGSGNRALLDRIAQENGDNFFRGLENKEDHLLWKKILEALICGRRGQALAAQGPEPKIQEEVSDRMALALVGIIRTLGVGIGEMEHSTASGSFFRDDFFGQEAPTLLSSPINLKLLLSRPLFGVTHGTYPSWGGLKKTEIHLLIKSMANHNIPNVDDSDVEAWLYELCDCLHAAYEDGTDIVTVYC
ncbi:MAG: hypothetical protein RKO66_05170 [Candidatus Contendobacter sp.]|nr:hypothetical protein [Candidatus Contendobacter sp.]